MSLGKVLVPANAVWLAQLREQFRSIALHLDRRLDDVADACLYGLEVVSRWQRGGFNTSSAEWGRGSFYERSGSIATWTRGTAAYAAQSQYQWPADKAMPSSLDR